MLGSDIFQRLIVLTRCGYHHKHDGIGWGQQIEIALKIAETERAKIVVHSIESMETKPYTRLPKSRAGGQGQ